MSRIAFERAAVLVAFDALEIDGAPLVDEPLSIRRKALERLLNARHPCLQLVEQTDDADLAEDWLELLPSIEGVVAKRADRRYAPGRGRDWLKVKRYRSIDCIVIGLAVDLDAPRLVLGLMHRDNLAHHLGRLGGVICHVERDRRPLFDPRQRVFRSHRSQEKRGIL